MELKFIEPSTAVLQYPKRVDGARTPFFDELVKDKLVDIAPYGLFVISGTNDTSNGVKKVKEVSLYSLEYELAAKQAASLSRSYDSGRFNYGEDNNTTTWGKDLIREGYDAALAQIKAGKDNMVTIDQAGIKISSADGVDTIYLNNGMIALVDKWTNTVNLAMGHFLNPATGTDFIGILADIIGGTLLAGQNLIIECPDPNGVSCSLKWTVAASSSTTGGCTCPPTWGICVGTQSMVSLRGPRICL